MDAPLSVTVAVDPHESNRHAFALTRVLNADNSVLAELDIDFQALRDIHPPEWAVDFLVFSSAVYALDKRHPRSLATDLWTRSFHLTMPVADAARWLPQRGALAAALSFLTGDQWRLDFTTRHDTFIRPRRRRERNFAASPTEVCLFSGGLDSLIGAIDALEESSDTSLLLVGHHDGQMAGPLSDQKGLLPHLFAAYPGRVSSLLPRVGHIEPAHEITLRSRSLVFIALGVFAANALGANTPLLIPENGTISVNAPLTPSRRGSCSTRTTHPHFLSLISSALANIGDKSTHINPLQFKTKGEAVTDCRNLPLLRRIATLSVSCAKRGHKREWQRRSAKGCGRCMPCIYRRAALNKAGLDKELYGLDVCAGEVNPDDTGEGPNDLRACLSFLQRAPSGSDIQRMLITSGTLDVATLGLHADTVVRAMDEIRRLFAAKGTSALKKRAGLP